MGVSKSRGRRCGKVPFLPPAFLYPSASPWPPYPSLHLSFLSFSEWRGNVLNQKSWMLRPKPPPAKTSPPSPWTGQPPSSRAPDGEWTGSRGAAPRISWQTSSGQRTWIHSAFALCSLSHTEPCLTDGSVPKCPGTRTVWFEVCVPLWGFCGSSAFPPARYTSLFSLLGAQCLGRNCGSEAAAHGCHGIGTCAWPSGPRALGHGSRWTQGRAGCFWLDFSSQTV